MKETFNWPWVEAQVGQTIEAWNHCRALAAEGGPREGLRHRLELELAVVARHRRQAAAVDGDGIADRGQRTVAYDSRLRFSDGRSGQPHCGRRLYHPGEYLCCGNADF